MKRSSAVFIFLGLLVAAVDTPAAPGGASNLSADQAWKAWQSARDARFTAGENEKMTMRQRREWLEARAQRLRTEGEAFIAAFPQDPRRWTVAWELITMPPSFIRSYGKNADQDFHDVVIDEAAAAEWNARLDELEKAMEAAPDLPDELREPLALRQLDQKLSTVTKARAGVESAEWAPPIREFTEFAAKNPASQSVAELACKFMYGFEAAQPPGESAALWREFATSPNLRLAAIAREKARAFGEIAGPVELAFTALDGRAVDLKNLRGKVVLIDFWATWCRPCMAEMPNVKKIYAAYHNQGFEIIGISCDIAPEHATGAKGKAARTGPQVWAFCQQNDMPWPQHYDGKKHNGGGNPLSIRFGITSIPATFLLDRRGEVVAMNLRGEKLEAEVKRLLGL